MTTAKKYLEILREREPQLWKEPLKESCFKMQGTLRYLFPFACSWSKTFSREKNGYHNQFINVMFLPISSLEGVPALAVGVRPFLHQGDHIHVFKVCGGVVISGQRGLRFGGLLRPLGGGRDATLALNSLRMASLSCWESAFQMQTGLRMQTLLWQRPVSRDPYLHQSLLRKSPRSAV